MNNTEKSEIYGDEAILIAKLFCRKDTDEWEEVFVGICTVMKRACGQRCIILCGIENKEGDVMSLSIDRNTKFETYAGMIFCELHFGKMNCDEVVEVLIMWKEVLCSYSLSFLQQRNRDIVLEQIRTAQKEMEIELGRCSDSNESLTLPPVSLETISQIYQTISSADIYQKESFHNVLYDNNYSYLRDLINMFPSLEALGEKDRILELLSVCRLILDVGYDDVVGVMFDEDMYINLFGLMEYKPDLPQKAEYRRQYQESVHYCNTILRDPSLESLIHKIYRLLFFRDAVDPQPIDEIIPSGLAAQIRLCIADLLQRICVDKSFVPALLDGFDGDETACVNSLRMIAELCSYCRGMSVGDKEALMQALEKKESELSTRLYHCLNSISSPDIKRLIYVVIEYRVTFDVIGFRKYVLQCGKYGEMGLIGCITRDLFDSMDYGIQLSCVTILRDLIFCDTTRNIEIIRYFYETLCPPMLTRLAVDRRDDSTVSGCILLIGLLGRCVELHGTNIQYLILKNGLFPIVLLLLQDDRSRREQLAAVQFMESCLESSSDWYRRFIVKRGYLLPILQYGEVNILRDNCVMSAIFHLIVVCCSTGLNDVQTVLRQHIDNYPHLLGMSIIKDMIEGKRKRDTDVINKESKVVCKQCKLD